MIKQAFGNMTANLVTLIDGAAPTVATLFATAEAKIDSAFSSIISNLEGAAAAGVQNGSATSSIGGLNGMGATPTVKCSALPRPHPVDSHELDHLDRTDAAQGEPELLI